MLPYTFSEATLCVREYENSVFSTWVLCIRGPSNDKNHYVSMYLSRLTTSTPSAASLNFSTAQTVVHPQPQQNQWGPGAVSNIIFGCIMVVIGALAL